MFGHLPCSLGGSCREMMARSKEWDRPPKQPTRGAETRRFTIPCLLKIGVNTE